MYNNRVNDGVPIQWTVMQSFKLMIPKTICHLETCSRHINGKKLHRRHKSHFCLGCGHGWFFSSTNFQVLRYIYIIIQFEKEIYFQNQFNIFFSFSSFLGCCGYGWQVMLLFWHVFSFSVPFTSRYLTRYQFPLVICSQVQLLCLPLRVNSTGFGMTVWDHKDPLVLNLRISELEGSIWWDSAFKPGWGFPEPLLSPGVTEIQRVGLPWWSSD